VRHSVKEQSAFLFEDDVPREQPAAFVPTDEQAQAIEHVHGPMLVVAGAGTGKTTVLTQRIARLLQQGHAKPDEILAITYTRASAHDLVVRLAKAWLGSKDDAAVQQVHRSGIKVGTFHAYCYDLLCRAGRRFELVDEKDLWVLLRRQIDDLGLEHFITAGDLGKFLTDLLNFFRRCSDELRGPDDYDRYVADLLAGREKPPRVCSSKQTLSDADAIARCREIARVFRRVEEKLAAAGMGTYGDVITRALALLEDSHSSQWLQRARARARFILIDEFQDSNVAQIRLAKQLAGNEANVFAVGDPDQAIYRFRGATSGAFDQFLDAFGVDRVKRVTMSGNRRSTQPILSTAYQVIARNPEITTVTLPGGEQWKRQPLSHARTSAEPNPMPRVRISGCGKGSEAPFVVGEIERMHKQGRKWSDFAVIYRNHFNRDEVVQRLRERNIPFVVEGVDLLETSEVRDLLAVLKFIHAGDAVSAVRVASLPQFNINGAHLRTAFANAGDNLAAETELATIDGGAAVLSRLSEARQLLEAAGKKAVAAISIAERCFALAPQQNRQAFAEFVACWAKKPEPLSGEGTLRDFLGYLELFIDAGGKVCQPEVGADGTPDTLLLESGKEKPSTQPTDAVRLMTAHAAKGLEFPVVFVIRVMSSSFPLNYKEDLVEFPNALRNRGNVPEEDDPKKLSEEEERRLFYVAVTRAEDEAILCGKLGGKKNPAPAGYLRELVDLKPGPLAGMIDFREVPEGTLVGELRASAAPHPRVHDWLAIPPLETTRILRLSPSAIESYSNCPLRYKLERDWNLPEEPGAAMQFGQAIHTALMGYFDAQRKGKSVDAETVIASFMDEFAKAKIDETLQRELYEKNGRRQLLAFLNSPAAKPYGEVKEIEHRIDMQIAGVQVSGRIDRVDENEEGLSVIDYKTGRPKTQEHAEKSLQLSVYALAMQKLGLVKAVIFENLEDRTTVTTTRESSDLKKAEQKIAEVAENIRAGKFEAKPGFHCNWCAYQALCPEQELVTITVASAAAN
jgi:DNA helicase II / ATP-dependent DNA helicase PcrA